MVTFFFVPQEGVLDSFCDTDDSVWTLMMDMQGCRERLTYDRPYSQGTVRRIWKIYRDGTWLCCALIDTMTFHRFSH